MEDISQPRVLEPIDSNSLSLISSSSTSNVCGNISGSFSRLSSQHPASPTIVHCEETAQNKWQFDRKDFVFESNSTPSKNNDATLKPRLHVRSRRSQIMGAKPRIPSKLHHTTSKLDLLDENRITTLPFPPPRGSEDKDLNVKRLKVNPINELRIHNNKANRRISYGIPLNSKSVHEEAHEQEDEDEHPIVLIEDYIKYSDHEYDILAKKKVSLADLKSKMNKRKDLHIPIKLKSSKADIRTLSSSLTLIPHIIEDPNQEEVITTAIQGHDIETLSEDAFQDDIASFDISDSVRNILDDIMKPINQETDKYLSDLRIESTLKKCVVCECPLYELSSLISNTNDFKEIVCGKCTEKYEEAAKIFENYEFETSGETSIESSASGLNSPQEISLNLMEGDLPGRLPLSTGMAQSNDRFSQDLIRRLQLQSVSNTLAKRGEAVDCPTMAWFLQAKKRIRWRWRVSGLLPQFLQKRYDTRSVGP